MADNVVLDIDGFTDDGTVIVGDTYSQQFSTERVNRYSVQFGYDVNTPSAKTFTDTDVEVTDNDITVTAHGLTTGLKGQLTSTGTLPAGLSTATDYFVIVVDADTIAFATSLANALAGTKIDITDEGTAAATNTFTPTSIAGGSIQIQKSNDAVTWFSEGSAVTVSADGNTLSEITTVTARYVRVKATLTAGRYLVNALFHFVGEET
jgi:hypothetical protein